MDDEFLQPGGAACSACSAYARAETMRNVVIADDSFSNFRSRVAGSCLGHRPNKVT